MSPQRFRRASALAVGLVAGLGSAQDPPRAVLLGLGAAGRLTAPDTTSDLPGLQRYFTDYAGNAVRRSNPDGTNVTTVVAGVNGPYGIAFDADTQQLVWTSSADEVVQAAAPDGASPHVVLESSFEESSPIVTSEGDLHVAYFIEGSELLKLSVDPSTGAEQRQVLLWLSSPDDVHGLALGPLHDVLYLGDAHGMMTRRLRLSDAHVTYLAYVETPPPPDPQPDPQPWPPLDPLPPPLLEPEGVH